MQIRLGTCPCCGHWHNDPKHNDMERLGREYEDKRKTKKEISKERRRVLGHR